MPAGAKFINDWGTIQIDDTHPNYAMKSKGSANSVWYPAPQDVNLATWTVPDGDALICAIASTTRSIFEYAGHDVGNQRFFYTMVDGGSSSHLVEWWAFDLPTDTGLPYGMRVWNASGQIMFDSNRPHARVIDGVALNAGNSFSATRTYDAGRKYAVVPAAGVWTAVNGNVVTFSGVKATASNKPIHPTQALVLDVTGY